MRPVLPRRSDIQNTLWSWNDTSCTGQDVVCRPHLLGISGSNKVGRQAACQGIDREDSIFSHYRIYNSAGCGDADGGMHAAYMTITLQSADHNRLVRAENAGPTPTPTRCPCPCVCLLWHLIQLYLLRPLMPALPSSWLAAGAGVGYPAPGPCASRDPCRQQRHGQHQGCGHQGRLEHSRHRR